MRLFTRIITDVFNYIVQRRGIGRRDDDDNDNDDDDNQHGSNESWSRGCVKRSRPIEAGVFAAIIAHCCCCLLFFVSGVRKSGLHAVQGFDDGRRRLANQFKQARRHHETTAAFSERHERS